MTTIVPDGRPEGVIGVVARLVAMIAGRGGPVMGQALVKVLVVPEVADHKVAAHVLTTAIGRVKVMAASRGAIGVRRSSVDGPMSVPKPTCGGRQNLKAHRSQTTSNRLNSTVKSSMH